MKCGATNERVVCDRLQGHTNQHAGSDERDGTRFYWTDPDEETPVTVREAASGMSLRDYFAGQVLIMQGPIIAAQLSRFADLSGEADAIARSCYRMADAMLAARETK